MTNMDQESWVTPAIATPIARSRLAMLGFSICEDGLYRRLSKHDSLAVHVDGYRAALYAESDDQSVRIQIASLPADCERLAQIVRAIG